MIIKEIKIGEPERKALVAGLRLLAAQRDSLAAPEQQRYPNRHEVEALAAALAQMAADTGTYVIRCADFVMSFTCDSAPVYPTPPNH